MFPGLGAQYMEMGAELYRCATSFREDIDTCFTILDTLLPPEENTLIKQLKESFLWGVETAEASGAQKHELLHETDTAQLAVFIIEYALARLLIRSGVIPAAIIGYSFGEYSAACIAGVFSLQNALRLIVVRARLIKELDEGAMTSLPLTAGQLTGVLDEFKQPRDAENRVLSKLSFAIDNGPSTIVSGAKEGVVLLEKKMKERKLLSVRLPATRAMHSSQMEPAAEALLKEVSTVTLNPPQIPLMSNVTGKWLTGEEAVDPAYWSRQLKETVQFAGGIRALLKKPGNPIFIEVGPGSELAVLLRYFIKDGKEVKVLTTLRNPRKKVRDMELVEKTLSKLHDSGVPVDPVTIARGKGTPGSAVEYCDDTPGLSALFVSRDGIPLFIKWLQASRINRLWVTPRLFRGILATRLDARDTAYLQQLIIYGAGIKPGTVKKWFAAANPDIELAVLYGMPEIAGCKFCYFIGPEDTENSFIPLGKPIKGVRTVLLDKSLKICEPGLFGDLYIRTPYLSAGYEGNEPLTRSRFIPNPLGNNPGEMIFRTGERAKLMKSGNIQLDLPETETNQVWGTIKELVPPTNEVEEKLVRIWQTILKWDDIGIDDDFFEVLGHSLGIMKMASEIYETFAVEMSVHQLFAKPTIREIATYILSVQSGEVGSKASGLYEDAPYIVFNETGGRNIFLFPPKIAFGLEYKGLSQLLPSCRFYAF
ncbi:MAG: acyltransferase domain-containing protein, partial [bacterium]|nr:acyltransferase domain-containing protein [bacterium]